MDFLALCNKLHEKTGESGGDLVTVVGQSGYNKRVVGYIHDAWEEIQTAHTTWLFMRHEALPTMASGQDVIDAEAWVVANKSLSIDEYHKATFSIYTTAKGVSDESKLQYVPWDKWKLRFGLEYGDGVIGRPTHITKVPNNDTLLVGPVANDSYTLAFQFSQAPSELLLDVDTPAIVTSLHMVIVWRALELYGYAEEAKWLTEQGRRNYRKLFRRLQRRELPEISIGGPLA